MNAPKEQELSDLISFFSSRFEEKFRKGDAEHAGTAEDFDALSPLELLYQALNENLDQFAYLAKAIRKLEAEIAVSSLRAE